MENVLNSSLSYVTLDEICLYFTLSDTILENKNYGCLNIELYYYLIFLLKTVEVPSECFEN